MGWSGVSLASQYAGTSLQDGLGNQHSVHIFKSWMQRSWEQRLRASKVQAILELNNSVDSRGDKHAAGSDPYYSPPKDHPPQPSLSSTPVQGQYQKGTLNGLTTACLQAAKVCNSTSPPCRPRPSSSQRGSKDCLAGCCMAAGSCSCTAKTLLKTRVHEERDQTENIVYRRGLGRRE